MPATKPTPSATATVRAPGTAQPTPTPTPMSVPTAYVTAAAAAPIATWRRPENIVPRPVSRLTPAPTAKRATRLRASAAVNATGPLVARYGSTGTAAPRANATNDPNA